MKLYSDLAFALALSLLTGLLVNISELPATFTPLAIAQTAFLYINLRFSLDVIPALLISLGSVAILPLLPASLDLPPDIIWQYPVFLIGMTLALVPVGPNEGRFRSLTASLLLGAAAWWQISLLAPALALLAVMTIARQSRGLISFPGFLLGVAAIALPDMVLTGNIPNPAFDAEQVGIHLISPNRGLIWHAFWLLPVLLLVLKKRYRSENHVAQSQTAFLFALLLTPLCLATGLAEPVTWRVGGIPFGLGITLMGMLAFGCTLPLVQKKQSFLLAILPLFAIAAWVNYAASLRPEARVWLDEPDINAWPERIWSFADIQALAPDALDTPGRFDRQYTALRNKDSLLPAWRSAAADGARELDLLARSTWDRGDWNALSAFLSQMTTSTIHPAATAMLPDLFLIAPGHLLRDYLEARRDAMLALAGRQDTACFIWAEGGMFSAIDLLPQTEQQRLFAAEQNLFADQTAQSLVPLHTGKPFGTGKPPLTEGSPQIGGTFKNRLAFSRIWLKARQENDWRNNLKPQNQIDTDAARLSWCLQRALIMDRAIALPEEDMRTSMSYMFRQSLPQARNNRL